jgi:hypothetical protein
MQEAQVEAGRCAESVGAAGFQQRDGSGLKGNYFEQDFGRVFDSAK